MFRGANQKGNKAPLATCVRSEGSQPCRAVLGPVLVQGPFPQTSRNSRVHGHLSCTTDMLAGTSPAHLKNYLEFTPFDLELGAAARSRASPSADMKANQNQSRNAEKNKSLAPETGDLRWACVNNQSQREGVGVGGCPAVISLSVLLLKVSKRELSDLGVAALSRCFCRWAKSILGRT